MLFSILVLLPFALLSSACKYAGAKWKIGSINFYVRLYVCTIGFGACLLRIRIPYTNSFKWFKWWSYSLVKIGWLWLICWIWTCGKSADLLDCRDCYQNVRWFSPVRLPLWQNPMTVIAIRELLAEIDRSPWPCIWSISLLDWLELSESFIYVLFISRFL